MLHFMSAELPIMTGSSNTVTLYSWLATEYKKNIYFRDSIEGKSLLKFKDVPSKTK